MRYKDNKKIENYGITLISLVVTIVVIFILAGASIQIAFNEDGVITKVTEEKEKQDIAMYEEKIEVIKINWETRKKLDDTITIDAFWQDLEEAKIINDRTTAVQAQSEEGTYQITTPEGYQIIIQEPTI